MANIRKNIYLYLTLACFLGIILIFVFDGYIGLYDTLTVANGEFPVTISADQWQARGVPDFTPTTSANYGDKLTFTYKLDNRHFSAYKPVINVSVWKNQVKLADLLSTTLTAKAFGKAQADWVFDTTQFASANITAGTNYDFTMVIQRGDIQRKVIIYIYQGVNPEKIIPVPQPGG